MQAPDGRRTRRPAVASQECWPSRASTCQPGQTSVATTNTAHTPARMRQTAGGRAGRRWPGHRTNKRKKLLLPLPRPPAPSLTLCSLHAIGTRILRLARRSRAHIARSGRNIDSSHEPACLGNNVILTNAPCASHRTALMPVHRTSRIARIPVGKSCMSELGHRQSFWAFPLD
jgi:hypothetical protein